jgi:hypothetical protein
MLQYLKISLLTLCFSLCSLSQAATLASWNEDTDKMDLGVAKVKLRVTGNVDYALDGYTEDFIAVTNEFNLNVSGKHLIVKAFCKIQITSATTICLDALTGRFSGTNGTQFDCKINGKDSDNFDLPLEAGMCMEIDLKGKLNKAPQGSFNIQVTGKVAKEKFDKRLVRLSF